MGNSKICLKDCKIGDFNFYRELIINIHTILLMETFTFMMYMEDILISTKRFWTYISYEKYF